MATTKDTTEKTKEARPNDGSVGQATEEVKVEKASGKSGKKKIAAGVLHIEATFNNTKVLFSDKSGNTLFWSSAGSLGFRGAKKGTPFVASKIGDLIGGKAAQIGVKEADVAVLGVGSGRESAIRAFMAHGIQITSIVDRTPVPHNGPKAKKPRRV